MIQSFLLGNVSKCLLKVSKSASSKHHFLLCALQICRCISILFIIGVQVHDIQKSPSQNEQISDPPGNMLMHIDTVDYWYAV
ncbi:hypothetical protein PVAP13_5NG508172 [Panicum virgatum]|uniref:Uncharacterized protein n=1 Tax=Panicum virgatum TaxID=38727 RepID=A0A8T0S2G1_PANVG|nr:hypothetical protein PVAP13_5NG508172 [Panicum virgatum]